jgi:phenylacetate-CoA ligase
MVTRGAEAAYALLARASPFDAWRQFRVFQENQWRPAVELRELQWRKLRALLLAAYADVPFYRRLWATNGVDPRRFRSLADIANLPVVSRQDLRRGQAEDEFGLGRFGRLEAVHTSGTTGVPLALPTTAANFQSKYAGHLRQWYATGWRLGMRSAVLYHSGHPQFQGRYGGQAGKESFALARKLALGLAHRRVWLEPYRESVSGHDRFPADWYRALRRRPPYLLETLEFNLPVLHDFIERRNLPRLRIPKTFVLGTLSPQRRTIYENAFSTEIFNRYSPHEMEGVAFACDRHRGMHVAIDAYHVEFLDDRHGSVDPEGVANLVITDLDSYVMPLIRYRIGDLGFYYEERCVCGRGFPLMGDLCGRAFDVFRLPGGRVVAPSRIAAVLQDEPSVGLFQVVEERARGIVANVVPGRGWGPEVAERLRGKLTALLGGTRIVAVDVVDGIRLESNGKVAWCKASSV